VWGALILNIREATFAGGLKVFVTLYVRLGGDFEMGPHSAFVYGSNRLHVVDPNLPKTPHHPAFVSEMFFRFCHIYRKVNQTLLLKLALATQGVSHILGNSAHWRYGSLFIRKGKRRANIASRFIQIRIHSWPMLISYISTALWAEERNKR